MPFRVGAVVCWQAVKMLARLHHRLGQPQRAVACLEAYLREYPLSADLTHINILAELYMEAGRYAETVDLIRRAQRELCPDGSLPVDLAVRGEPRTLGILHVGCLGTAACAALTHHEPAVALPTCA